MPAVCELTVSGVQGFLSFSLFNEKGKEITSIQAASIEIIEDNSKLFCIKKNCSKFREMSREKASDYERWRERRRAITNDGGRLRTMAGEASPSDGVPKGRRRRGEEGVGRGEDNG